MMSRQSDLREISQSQQLLESQRQTGFTLIEMLVVILLISLLAAVLVTATLSALTRSKKATTEALIKKVEEGLRTYESELQRIPEPNATVTVKKRREWRTITYPDTLKGQSAQLHAILGAKIRNVKSVDPATNQKTYSEVGPYVEFRKNEIKDGEKGNFKKPIVDAWKNTLRVRFNGQDHSSKPDCGSRNNEDWVDIWSEGARIEDDLNNGCNDDDINNFGTAQ